MLSAPVPATGPVVVLQLTGSPLIAGVKKGAEIFQLTDPIGAKVELPVTRTLKVTEPPRGEVVGVIALRVAELVAMVTVTWLEAAVV